MTTPSSTSTSGTLPTECSTSGSFGPTKLFVKRLKKNGCGGTGSPRSARWPFELTAMQ